MPVNIIHIKQDIIKVRKVGNIMENKCFPNPMSVIVQFHFKKMSYFTMILPKQIGIVSKGAEHAGKIPRNQKTEVKLWLNAIVAL